jgi:16S rRNA (cytidine1402-2'-O)-methyltransferase
VSWRIEPKKLRTLQNKNMGTLYLVATPIGNLEDISSRALRILSQVSLVAAEDTRHTGKLLAHFQIHTPLTSYHEHNKLAKLEKILTALEHGDVALVSDAGTPALNDPGYELVRAILAAGHRLSPVPGPSAPLAALVSSGLPTDAFLYLGYLPRKTADRRQLLGEVSELTYTLIFLETPHRLAEALRDLEIILGDRQMCVARELTKLHEEIYHGLISQAQAHFSTQPVRGEFTLVVAGRSPVKVDWNEAQLDEVIQMELAKGASAAQIAANLAVQSGWPRRKIYQKVLELSMPRSGEENGQ